MIVKNEQEQWIGCTVCGVQIELRRRTLQNPETVLLMMEQLRENHAGCEQYKDDPAKLRLHRAWADGMQREMRGVTA